MHVVKNILCSGLLFKSYCKCNFCPKGKFFLTHHSQVRVRWGGTEGIWPSILSTKRICLRSSAHLSSKWVRISHFVHCAHKWIPVRCGFKGKRIWSYCWWSCSLVHLWRKQIGFWVTGGGTKCSGWGRKGVFCGKSSFGGLCKKGICSKWVRAFEGISSEWIWLDRKSKT